MLFFDPTMIILIPAIILSMWAQINISSTIGRYERVQARSSLTGAQVAQRILQANGIYDVRVEAVRGHLTDHYDPRTKVVRLSESVYGKTSLAALGVAAHEVGHAIQHENDYMPLRIRSALAPIAQFGSYGSWILLIVGILLSSMSLVEVGIWLFVAVVLFQLVTLPVEFNASSRALVQLESGGYLESDEISGSRKVLRAAAMTYVAAVVMAILQLVRLLAIAGIFNRD
ncbi:MAG: zinc metallopeptidase [Bacillota bacterium]|nr:zinc metallopeptidase [Bacillota bacterium]